MRSKHWQSGYLYEIPLILMAVAVLLAILLPTLPKVAGKVLALAGAVVIIGGLYYMIVIAGWQPGDTSRLRWPWSLVVFLAIALLVVLAAGVYVSR
jgi:hypothetical protein